MARLILASASPRRRVLLEQLGLEFTIRPARIREEDFVAYPPAQRVEKLALAKARAVTADLKAGEVILGADTIVVCQGRVLGKPSSAEQAFEMLSFLSGKLHQVYTGLALIGGNPEKQVLTYECTSVLFRTLTAPEIAAYVATGEPLDKAGGYGIQGKGAALVKAVYGCYFNVVGLPLARLVPLLAEFGVYVWGNEEIEFGGQV
ncbi:MAG: nucleoside triphosphate pyrophosphatase [Clostridia bacterium]|nr:nucleoside triphosphate pyrophosphatase [Clostridia bacterium]